MSLTDSEVENLRFHLGYGNVSVGAYPYTPDGFRELFSQVVGPNLASGTTTTSQTAVTEPGIWSITLASASGFAAFDHVVVDAGDDAEVAAVRALSGSVLTARFARAHPGTGWGVHTLSPVARLRMLLFAADKAWRKIGDADVHLRAGIKRADEVEFFPGAELLGIRAGHYAEIQRLLSSLVQVRVNDQASRRASGRVEVY